MIYMQIGEPIGFEAPVQMEQGDGVCRLLRASSD